jgi:large subunit ribosomal protein L20
MRVKSPRRQRHNKILNLAKGYRMARHRWYKIAHESVIHAGQYAFAGRKLRKRDFRALWIVRINAALSDLGVKYHQFISAMKKSSIQLDRKILSELATNHPEAFKKVVEAVGFKPSK